MTSNSDSLTMSWGEKTENWRFLLQTGRNQQSMSSLVDTAGGGERGEDAHPLGRILDDVGLSHREGRGDGRRGGGRRQEGESKMGFLLVYSPLVQTLLGA